jgi:hypothetical protein
MDILQCDQQLLNLQQRDIFLCEQHLFKSTTKGWEDISIIKASKTWDTRTFYTCSRVRVWHSNIIIILFMGRDTMCNRPLATVCQRHVMLIQNGSSGLNSLRNSKAPPALQHRLTSDWIPAGCVSRDLKLMMANQIRELQYPRSNRHCSITKRQGRHNNSRAARIRSDQSRHNNLRYSFSCHLADAIRTVEKQ